MGWVRTNKYFRLFLGCAIIFACVLLYVSHRTQNRQGAFLSDVLSWGQSGENEVRYFTLENSSFRNHSLHLVGREVGERGRPKDSRLFDLQFNLTARSLSALKSAIKVAETKTFPWKPLKAKDVDCSELFFQHKDEIERIQKMEHSHPNDTLTDDEITKMASTCAKFVQDYGFITSELTEEEKNFPIAFSILMFKDAEQVINLLRAIYRPQNLYCIHVDSKSNQSLHRAIEAVASCFPNVFLASRFVNVKWGTFTVLEPELICMEDLWKYKHWKYFINLTGQEFPLKTNYELVRILSVYNGANDLSSTVKRANKNRWKRAGPPPHGLRLVKGSVHITVNRDFVDFILHSQVAKDFLNWTKQTSIPDETFFATLNQNPQLGIRGAYKGEPDSNSTVKPFLTRYKNWGSYPCEGRKRVRGICILSAGDLPFLDGRPEFFANKFHSDYSRFALECLAERIYNRTRDEVLGHISFDTSYYENLPFLKNVVTVPKTSGVKTSR